MVPLAVDFCLRGLSLSSPATCQASALKDAVAADAPRAPGRAGHLWPWEPTSFVIQDVSRLVSNDEIIATYLQRVLAARVDAYSLCKASLEWVGLDTVTPLPRFASRDRLLQAQTLLARLRETDTPPFGPVAYRRPQEAYFRLCLPPVVEERNGSFALIDGLHRMLAAHEAGYARVRVLLVSDIDLPLPSTTRRWDSVYTVNANFLERLPPKVRRRLSRLAKFHRYQDEFFRPLGAFLNSQGFWFDSLNMLADHMHHVARTDPTDVHQHFIARPKQLDGRRVARHAI